MAHWSVTLTPIHVHGLMSSHLAVHDAFGMYGRPTGWTWDPRDSVSLMFGYPVGPGKEVGVSAFDCCSALLICHKESFSGPRQRRDHGSQRRSNLCHPLPFP